MILLIFNKTSYTECVLPNLHNSDYYLPVYIFTGQRKEVLNIRLDVMNGRWAIYDNRYLNLSVDGISVSNHLLQPGDQINLELNGKAILTMLVVDRARRLCVPKKILLDENRKINVGKSKNNDIIYNFRNYVSDKQAFFVHKSDGYYIETCKSYGTYINGRGIEGSMKLTLGDRVQIFGLTIMYLPGMLAVYTNVSESYGLKDGLLIFHPAVPVRIEERIKISEEYYNRSPRELYQIISKQVEIEGPPAKRNEQTQSVLLNIGPAFTMAIPVLLGIFTAIYAAHNSQQSVDVFMYAGIITAFISAIIGIVWAILNVTYAKQEQEAEEYYRFHEYAEYLSRIVTRLGEYSEHNRNAMDKNYPSAEECSRYNGKNAALWRRNSMHEDMFFVRLGVGKIPFQVSIKVPQERLGMNIDFLTDKPQKIRDKYMYLRDVPIGISLVSHRLIGLVGCKGNSKKRCLDLMNIMSVQLASNICYTDLKLAYIYDRNHGDRDRDWCIFRWYPHVWSEDNSIRFIAGNAAERRDVFFELTDVIRKRQKDHNNAGEKKGFMLPHYVLFISDPELLRGEILANYLYHAGNVSGITAFLMTESLDQLPNECDYVVQNDQDFCGVYSLIAKQEKHMPIKFDQISRQAVEAQARQLSSVKVKETEKSQSMPTTVSFLELYGSDRPEGLHIAERWTKNRTYESLGVPIGRKKGNTNLYLDIHEKYHGPHGLIAGTTGSGKSELLQTYILSLAVNFSPEDIAFLLIDFKGGGMANLFSSLPHMVGQITNLSGNEIQRAMISITSENIRRERIFSEYGVNHIDEYTVLYKNDEATLPVPHLFIIVDEFAELKKTNIGFMNELISVAQVGRSLGVHLILATQKPSGIVDESIMSNSRFRICLRVQEQKDSFDVLHRPDAAFITQAGRGFFQIGMDEIFECFQSAYSGERYNNKSVHRKASVELITLNGKRAVVGNGSVNRESQTNGRLSMKANEARQIDVIVDYIGKIVERNRIKESKQLWLPPLSKKIYWNELSKFGAMDGDNPEVSKEPSLRVDVGLCDDPANQRQIPLTLDFLTGGNHVIFGTGSTGKSTFLLTAAYGLLMRYDSSELHMYVLDFSSHLLNSLTPSAAVGAVILDNDKEKINRLLSMLERILPERKMILSGGSFSGYCKRGSKMPAIVVIIDDIGAAFSKFTEQQKGRITHLIREGNTFGIFFLVSATGISINNMPQSIADYFKKTISLEQNDKYKYMETLRVQSITIMPEHGVRGRGISVIGSRVLEFQTALPLKAESEYAMGDKIGKNLIARNAVYSGKTAVVIPELPKNPRYRDLTSTHEFSEGVRSREMLPVGWNIEDATVYGVSLRHTYCYTVSGSAKSGKTTFMTTLMLTVLKMNAHVAVVEIHGDSMEIFSKQHNIEYYHGENGLLEFCQMMVPVIREKNSTRQDLLKGGTSSQQIFKELNKTQTFVFLVDLLDFVKTSELSKFVHENTRAFLENVITKGSSLGVYFVAELRTEDAVEGSAYKLFRTYTEYRQGIHLGGKITSLRFYDFSGMRITEQMSSIKKGIGVVRDPEDETRPIYVSIPDLEQ